MSRGKTSSAFQRDLPFCLMTQACCISGIIQDIILRVSAIFRVLPPDKDLARHHRMTTLFLRINDQELYIGLKGSVLRYIKVFMRSLGGILPAVGGRNKQVTRKAIVISLLSIFMIQGPFFVVSGYGGKGLPDPLDRNAAWKPGKEKDGVKVYSLRWPERDVLVFKADTTMNTSLNSLLALMVDIENYVRWIGGCKGSKVLKKVSDTEYIGYIVINGILIFSDRDFVVHVRAFQDPISKIVRVQYTSLDGYLPKLTRTVRVTDNQGSWTAVPLAENRVRLIWQGRLNPGGWFPTWILRLLLDTVVLSTVEDIIEEVKKERYQNAIFKGFK